MNDVKLSIIIPVFNTEKYIQKCLDSISLYEYDDIEIIVINDGSLDSSLNICQKYQGFDSRIIVIDKDNSGVSDTRNYGIRAARGKYVMFVDSDDYLSNNWFRIMNYLDNDDIYYFSTLIDSNSSKEEMLNFIIGNNNEKITLAGPISKAFKREFLIKESIFFHKNISNGEDLLFNVEALLKCKKYLIINISFYYYRMFIGQYKNSNIDKLLESTKVINIEFEKILNGYDSVINYFKVRSIKVLLNRITNNFSFFVAIKKMKFSLDFPFNDYINIGIKSNEKMDKFICVLCKFRLYFLIYLLYKIKNKNNSRKDCIVEIL